MSKYYVTDDAEIFSRLQAYQLPVINLTSEVLSDLQNSEIIVVGKTGEAKKLMTSLASRGISRIKLSFVEPDGKNPWQVLLKNPKHFFWDDARTLWEAPDAKNLVFYRCGIPSMDLNLKWRIPELCITAGPYNMGKSLFSQLLGLNFVAENSEQKWGILHDEDGVIPEKALGSNVLFCSWEDKAEKMKENAIKTALNKSIDQEIFLRKTHYVCRDVNEERLVEWFIDLVRYYHERFGTNFFVFDPWNEFDHVRPAGMTETDYVGEMMKTFRRLVQELQIIIMIVTHVPAKMIRGNGEIEPFRLAHCHGSVQFANRADRGFCVLRSKSLGGDHMAVRFDKVKMEPEMGKTGCCAFVYDAETNSLKFDMYASVQLREVWK